MYLTKLYINKYIQCTIKCIYINYKSLDSDIFSFTSMNWYELVRNLGEYGQGSTLSVSTMWVPIFVSRGDLILRSFGIWSALDVHVLFQSLHHLLQRIIISL